MTRLAFVDTETLGLDIDLHAVWEVGMILRDDTHNDEEFRWFLPVDSFAFADPFALKLNGFHDRYPSGIYNIDQKDGRVGKVAEDGITSLESFSRQFIALTRDAHLIGMVPSFDEERLRRIVRSVGLLHAWHYQVVDVELLAVGALHGKHRGTNWTPPELPYDSEDLSARFAIDPDKYERHTALGDCAWSRDLYDAVLAQAKS